jgi:uncharacterized protein with NAD-binding domain and iron-sulfur cluster|tara:strand:+ start:158 stop:391 length:234 start_codon:yes stop_codon:yes gene_type:complete
MASKQEGNLVGFRIFFDASGNLMTELNKIPKNEVDKIFKEPEEQKIISTVLEQALYNLEGLHEKIENELDALNTRTF